MKYVVMAFLGLSLVGFGGFQYWISTPEYSFAKIGEAIQTKNKALFQDHVDLKRLSDTIVDEAIQMTSQETSKSKNFLVNLGGLVATQVMNANKSVFEQAVEREIHKIFEFDRKIASKKGKSVAAYLEGSATEFHVIGFEKKDCSKQVCYFSITFEHQLSRKKFDVLSKMEKSGNSWRMVELVDLVKNLKKART